MLESNLDEVYSQEELERLILGTILTIHKLSGAQKLSPAHFEDTRNQAVFEAMLELDERKQPIESAQIVEVLKHRGIDRCVRYLRQLKAYKVKKVLFKNIIDVLKDRYLRRKIGAIKNS